MRHRVQRLHARAIRETDPPTARWAAALQLPCGAFDLAVDVVNCPPGCVRYNVRSTVSSAALAGVLAGVVRVVI